MKKLMVLAAFTLVMGCHKDGDILSIKPGHEYEVTNILIKNSSGIWEDARWIIFPFAEKITFKKFHPLGGSGDGSVKVIDDTYTSNDYSTYGALYDQLCGCYYYDWYTYTVTYTKRQVNEYSFSWDKESRKNISIKFSEYDPIIQGHDPNQKSFWSFLNGEYTVIGASKEPGKVYPDVIVLKTAMVEIVLKE